MRLAIVHNLPSGGALRAASAQLAVLATRHELALYTLSTAETELADLSFVGERTVFDFTRSPALERPLGMFDPLVRLAELRRLDKVYASVARAIEASQADAVLVHPCMFTQAPRVLEHLTTPSVYFCQEPPRALHEPLPDAPPPAATLVERLRELRHRPFAALLKSYQIAVDRAACRAAHTVAVSSRFMAAAVERIYGRTPAVTPLGVDSARFVPGTGERARHVLAVGALSPWKGFDLAIAALGLVSANERPPLTIVSDRSQGGYADELHARAAAAGVSLSLKSRIGDAELVTLYQTALLTLVTPVREPFGLVPLESMACGTAVIGVAEGGVPESVEHGVTGLVVPREPRAVADALGELLADRERADAFGRAGRAAVLARWTWAASAERLETLLENARRSVVR